MSYWTEEQLAGHLRGFKQAHGIQATEQQARPAKPSKYRNRKVDGFDSEKERAYWQQLELRAKAGEITHLQRQVPFALVVNGILVCSYVADFVWQEGERRIVSDCKSSATRKIPVYRIKAKLMKACLGIDVVEV